LEITITRVNTIAECRIIEELAAAIWGPVGVVPDHLLITMAKNKGVVLLMWDGDRPIGFCFSFVSFTGRYTLKHCSHQAGVLPQYQNRNLGARLKWAQRAAILEQGIEHVTWTYDPLESRNATLNLHKLGALCQTYRRNIYGLVDDDLNRGVETDRFEVDWWLNSPWVTARAGGRPPTADRRPPLVNEAIWRDNSPPAPNDAYSLPSTPRCRVEIPADYQAVKRTDISLARAWRAQTRLIFEDAFGRGYVATDLIRNGPRSFYLLEKHFLLTDGDGSG
jgi:predicted GNAT superfamily acetyltransferase